MEPDLRPTTVLVTGGASGLGAAVVDELDALGWQVLVVDRQAATGRGVHDFAKADLAESAEATAAVRELIERHGGVDHVVTCAGWDAPGRLEDVESEIWEQVVRINLLGTAAVVRAALPSVRERRGRIVTIASTLGHRGVSDATAYCASKFGIVGFTRALMDELRDQVGVTLLTPGGMSTAFFDGRDDQYKPPPDARLADPADVAQTVVFVLTRPAGLEVRELVVAGAPEPTWP